MNWTGRRMRALLFNDRNPSHKRFVFRQRKPKPPILIFQNTFANLNTITHISPSFCENQVDAENPSWQQPYWEGKFRSEVILSLYINWKKDFGTSKST